MSAPFALMDLECEWAQLVSDLDAEVESIGEENLNLYRQCALCLAYIPLSDYYTVHLPLHGYTVH